MSYNLLLTDIDTNQIALDIKSDDLEELNLVYETLMESVCVGYLLHIVRIDESGVTLVKQFQTKII